MQPFDCGCTEFGEARCLKHALWPCHSAALTDQTPIVTSPCPPCWLEQMRGVQIHSAALPTRKLTPGIAAGDKEPKYAKPVVLKPES